VKGLLFVVTAPSGAGKTSLINAVLAEQSRLRLSVSYTTRPPRPSEQNGREYHFVDDATFSAMLERGEFLESALVHGHRYGTSQAAIAGALDGGYDLLLEIDWQGAQQVRRLVPECIGIFLLPPSFGELERRLRARGQDSGEVIARRMAVARDEISHFPESDYVIVNKDFETAKRDMLAIIRAERLVTRRQVSRIGELF
jgi:guanylate kinase